MAEVIKNHGRVSIVPEGDWENKKYDSLSLVRHPDTGKVYISKKPVPVDIDVDNDEYWMFLLTSENPVQNKVIYNMLASIETALDNILGE